jgi:hypothetical protein
MKTTVEISEPLLREARRRAAADGVTFRELVERGLRNALAERESKKPFRLRDASFKGRGLNPDLHDSSWERVRDLTYDGRGG